MTDGRRRAVLFASTSPERAARVLDNVRRRWPDHDWTVCVKVQERTWCPAGCSVVPVPRGRPGITAVRRLRQSGFDLSVACWTGDKGYARLKSMHLLTPARERHVYNENIDSFELLHHERQPAWVRHIRWRFGSHGGQSSATLVGLARRLYRTTLGPVLGTCFLLTRHLLWAIGLGRRARAQT